MNKLIFSIIICALCGIPNVSAEDTFFDNPGISDVEGRIELEGYYSRDDEYVYYDRDEEFIVEGANPATFEVIDFYIGKDENGVYNEGKYVDGIDIHSFQLLNFKYAKDINAVYYIFNEFSLLTLADATTFEVDESNMFSTDQDSVYYDGEIITDADPKTFEVITANYFKDRNGIYYSEECSGRYCDETPVFIESSDVESFEIIDEHLSKDKNNVYCGKYIRSIRNHYLDYMCYLEFTDADDYTDNDAYNKCSEATITNIVDPETFEVLTEHYYKDKNVIYAGTNCPSDATGIDMNSFEVVNEVVVKDKNNIYGIGGRVLEFVDYNSLIVVNDKFIKDKDNIYNLVTYPVVPKSIDDITPSLEIVEGIGSYYFDYLGSTIYRDNMYIYEENDGEFFILEGVDKETFEVINDLYAKDKNHVYDIEYDIEIKRGVDPETFEAINEDYSKDKYSVYKWSELSLADPGTFEIIDDIYSKDIRRVYVNSVMIKYADPETFEVIGAALSRDKRFVYTWGNILEGAGTDIELLNGDEDTWYMYAKDSNYVYFIDYRGRIKRIDWVDVDTFEIIDLGYTFKDKNGIYVNESSDSRFNFEVEKCYAGNCKMTYTLSYDNGFLGSKAIDNFDKINDLYIKDDHNAYYLPYGTEYEVEPVFDIDSSTFEVLHGYYTKDAYNVFYRWFSIPDADPKTFEMLGENIAKDKNHIYFNGDIITGADVETLESAVENIEWNYDDKVKDKNGTYEVVNGKLANIDNDYNDFYQYIEKKLLNGGFSDVADVYILYRRSIENLASMRIISGYDDGTFRPYDTVNRAEALSVILKSVENNISYLYDNEELCMFSDVEKDVWYEPYVKAGVKKGIISGYPDGTFKGGDTVNFAEALKMIFGAYGIDIYQINKAPWHEAYLDAVARIEIHIYDNGDFPGFNNPNQLLTRAELVYVLDSFIKKVRNGYFDNEEWRKNKMGKLN